MPLAYSYIRFGAEPQTFGDSVRRQVEKAEAWATAHNLTVDTTSYRELKGVSAFKRKNCTDGYYLKAIIDAVDKRVIPQGSYLFVVRHLADEPSLVMAKVQVDDDDPLAPLQEERSDLQDACLLSGKREATRRVNEAQEVVWNAKAMPEQRPDAS